MTKDIENNRKVLPAGWRWVRLGEVCEINPRRNDISRLDNEPTSFVPMDAVNAERGIIREVAKRQFTEVKKGYTYFEEGDVLFAKITPCMQNGKHAIARGLIGKFGFASTEFHVIRAKKDIVAEWIHYFVRQPTVLHEASNHFTGAVGQQRVPDDFLKSLEIPIAPLEEQKRIAGILNKKMEAVEKAKAAAQARIDGAKALTAAYLRQVFPKAGDKLPVGWRLARLGDVCNTANGFGFPEHLQGRRNLPYPLIKVSDMNAPGAEITVSSAANTVDDEILKMIGGRVYPHGTVIFPKVGGALLTNKKRILGKQACFDNNVMGLVPKDIDSLYLFFWFQTIDLRTLSNVQALPSIKQSIVAELKVPMPSIREQKRIADTLSAQMASVNRLQAEVTTHMEEITALPAAMLRQAFNGEI